MAARRERVVQSGDRIESDAAADRGAGGAAAQRAVMGEVPTSRSPSRRSLRCRRKRALTRNDGDRLLAVLVVPSQLRRRDDAEGSSAPTTCSSERNLDIRIQNEIRNAADDAIVDARVRAAGLDRKRIDALTTVARPASITVTASGESATRPNFAACCRWGSRCC